MLVLDTSYTLEMMTERGTLHSVTCRDLGGFFAHVWSVHPFASMLTTEKWTSRFGMPTHHKLADRHTFIEGKVGRFKMLQKFFILNFLISQIGLFIGLFFLILRRPIKIIRVGDPLYLGLFGLALSRLTGVPLVIRVNGNNNKVRENTGKPLYSRLLRSISIEQKIEHFVFPRADLVASPNQDNLDFSVAAGAKPDCVTIFRYGNLLAPEHLADPTKRTIDTELFSRLSIEPYKYLLCIGRLQPLKYPDDVIRTFACLRKKGHDGIKLIFAGEGDMLDDLTKLADQLGVLSHVVFAGNQNQTVLAQLNTFALSVVSPLTGRALSESALCAAAIVAYDIDWQSEIIITDQTGVLCPHRSWQSMADGVERYINDPKFALQMGINARNLSRSMLDPEQLDQHERKEYSALIQKCFSR
jgi:glycosyltransferase involved in cell wall biosynthesis